METTIHLFRPKLDLSLQDKPLIKFKSHLYFEEKDRLQETLKSLTSSPGSKIVFFKNGESLGEAFTDIYMVRTCSFTQIYTLQKLVVVVYKAEKTSQYSHDLNTGLVLDSNGRRLAEQQMGVRTHRRIFPVLQNV